MATVSHDIDEPSDADLIDAVRAGTVAAYGALYERHVAAAYNLARQLARSRAEQDDLVSEAFAKVLDMLRAGRGPDTAFRAYLLTALRNLAYDKTRRDRKVALADDVSTVTGVPDEAVRTEFDDPALSGLERSLAARAFARLPERWQAVLWHVEIEGESPADVAPVFGLTPNGVSALAYRAREGLRQAYLQVHLADTDDVHCRIAVERLGAWTRGGLARREKAQVEVHLDACARCRALAEELADVNGALRGLVAPLVLGIGVTGYLATAGGATVAAISTAGGVAGGAAAGAAAGPRQVLGVATSGVALAAALIVGLSVRDAAQPIPVVTPTPAQNETTEQPSEAPEPPVSPPPAPPTTEQQPTTTAPAPPPTTTTTTVPPTTTTTEPTTEPTTTEAPPSSWTPPGRTDPVPAYPPGHRPDRPRG